MSGYLALVWGSSFFLIAVGLEAFTPGVVAWGRLVVAVVALSLIPAARKRIDRSDLPAVTIVAIAGNAGPALLFAYAEQTLESAVAGMLNAAVHSQQRESPSPLAFDRSNAAMSWGWRSASSESSC